MRYLCFFLLLFVVASAKAQIVTYYPQLDDFEQEITLVFNLNFSKNEKAKGLFGQSEGLYLWAGASDNAAYPFQWTPEGQANFNAAFVPGTLTNMGNNRWKITLTPRTYFRVPAGKKIEVIGLLIKNAAGTPQTEDILLRPVVETALEEVVIKVRKPVIEQLSDRTVLNVAADINAAGATLFEVLQKAPGLAITGDEQLQMNGKSGLNVFIDGRASQLSGRDLSNYLQSLPAGAVEKVEIYSNPPARFDAQGNAGIINIKLKKGLGDGWNGSLFGGYTQNVHYRSQAGTNLNWRKGAFNAFGQWSGQSNYQHTFGYVRRQIGTQYFDNQTTDQDRSPIQQNWRTGVDCQISKYSVLGLMLNGRDNRTEMTTPGTTRISDNGILQQTLFTQNESRFRQAFVNPNLNYRFEKEGKFVLNADADWTRFDNTIDNSVQSQFLNNQSELVSKDVIQNDLQTNISIASFRSDANWTLKPWQANIEAGAKSAFSTTMNDLTAFRSFQDAAFQPDTNRSNTFEYQENIHAAYLNFRQKPNERWEWQAGLRGEYTDAEGISTDLLRRRLERPDTTYFNLFPSAFVQFAASENHSFKMAYTRRIGRPSYQDLNPFQQILDAYTSEIGNPYLRPAFTHNLEWTYTYRGAASLSFGVNRTRQPLQWITIQDGERAYATTTNIGQQENAYLNLNVPLPIKNWWFMYTYFGLYYNHYRADLPDGAFNGGRLGANLYMNHEFTLAKSWKAQVDGWWNAPTRELIYQSRGLGSVNIGLRKEFWQGKASLKMTFYDLFNTQRWKQSADFGQQNFTLYRKWESRGLRLSFTCKIGNQQVKSAREREGGAGSEQERIKAGTGARQ